MNFTSKNNSAPQISIPAIGLPVRNIFLSLISFFLLSFFTLGVKAQHINNHKLASNNSNLSVAACPTITAMTSTVCSGTGFTATPVNGTNGVVPAGTTYTWATPVVTGGGTGGSAQATGQSSISQTLTNPTNTAQTATYTVTPTSGACTGATFTVTVTVNPKPAITAMTSTICSGATFTATPVNGTNGVVPAGTTYTWATPVVTGGVTGGSAQATGQSSISQTLTNPTNTAQPETYTVTPLSGSCTGATFTVTVTVNPTASVTTVLPNLTYCNSVAAPAIANFTSNVAGVTYAWTSNADVGFGTSGTGNIPAYTATNLTNNPVVATVSVTATINGCTGPPKTFTVTVNPTPVVTISADYCSVPGRVRLTVNSSVTPATYLWNPGAITTQVYTVDIAGIYTVVATTAVGCTASASTTVSQDLVVNGNFSAGNTGFTSPPLGPNQYQYVADVAGNMELWPEGLYGIGANAQNYHPMFWGYDHTTGTGNYMIINGFPNGNPQPIVWQETITVVPNTNYYFAAWAKSLNDVGPFANLQFNINGTQLGVPTGALPAGVDNNVGPYTWIRFYGTWNSGANTSAILSITDLQSALNGNDFGLDDISFGTLDPLPFTIAPASTGPLCAGQTLNLTANITGGKPPVTCTWTISSGPN